MERARAYKALLQVLRSQGRKPRQARLFQQPGIVWFDLGVAIADTNHVRYGRAPGDIRSSSMIRSMTLYGLVGISSLSNWLATQMPKAACSKMRNRSKPGVPHA